MKMAEYDSTVRARRVSSYVLGRMITTISSVVDYGNRPPTYEALQFDLFSYAASMNFKYSDCREAVERTMQLLFSFQPLGVDAALECLEQLRIDMMADITPTAIQINVINLVRGKGQQRDREHLLASISNFTTHFISEEELISYL